MGDLLNQTVPNYAGALIKAETLPVTFTTFQSFDDAKAQVDAMVASCASLANSITTDEAYNLAMQKQVEIKRFLKALDDEAEPTRRKIQEARDAFFSLLHQLDTPMENVAKALAKETGRYKLWREEQVRQENQRKQREAELERQRKQREEDLRTLADEVAIARKAADDAAQRGQAETKSEIVGNLRRIEQALQAGTILNPIESATEIRQAVAFALQQEQARVAAAQLKAQGDKRGANRILKDAAKLETPIVDEVVSRRVESAPVVKRGPELQKAKGASVRVVWHVKAINDPRRVCHEHPELCEPSVSKLNDLAKRLEARPNIPGVDWEREVKTIGIRTAL